MSRFEKSFFDKVINGMILGKRKIGSPFKYNVEAPWELGRVYDMIFFPKNAFHQLVSNTFERMLPTLQYVVWNPITRNARNSGWTEQEKCYHNFFRGGFIMYHSLAQSMHPLAYSERARADNFFRRVETILPGIVVPDWAHHNNRAVDIDFEGALNPFRAMNMIEQESTPKPHYGYGYPSSISHIGNYRQLIGYYAQRIFFNENLRGNYFTGYYSEEKKNNIDSWYANAENSNILNLEKMPPEKLSEIKFQAERWMKNIDQFFPEYRNLSEPNATQIVYEPYLERTVDDICNHIFIKKWMDALESKAFTQEEYQHIYEFYLHQQDHSFWRMNPEDGLFVATPLYEKYVRVLHTPNVFNLRKYSARIVEQQYKDQLMNNYGVTMHTVEQFRKHHQKIIAELNKVTTDANVSASNLKKLRLFVSEEVYNPLFKKKLSKYSETKDSIVIELFKRHGINVLSDFDKVHSTTKEELYFMNRDIQDNYMSRLRNIVKTFPFKSLTNTVTNYE